MLLQKEIKTERIRQDRQRERERERESCNKIYKDSNLIQKLGIMFNQMPGKRKDVRLPPSLSPHNYFL